VLALVPPGVVTLTSALPAARAGAVAVIVVGLTTVYPVAFVPPNRTAAAPESPAKFVPVIVTIVPPVVGPKVGLSAVIVGGA
jgi:hypothetical protein